MIQFQQKLQCPLHKEQEIQFANISNPNLMLFQCQICLLKMQFKETFISISEIIKSEDNVPIQNWPLGIDQSMIDFLADQSIQNKKQIIKDKINIFYKELKSQILNTIEESQNEQLKILEEIQLEQNNLMELYNQYFRRQELKSIFTNQNEFDQSKYQLLLREIEQTKKQYLDDLNRKIGLNKDFENYISFDYCAFLKKIVLKILPQINFVPENIFSSNIDKIDQIEKQNISNQQNCYFDSYINQINSNLKQFKDIQSKLLLNFNNLQDQYQLNLQDVNIYTQGIMQQNIKKYYDKVSHLNEFIERVKKEKAINKQKIYLYKDNLNFSKEDIQESDIKKVFIRYKSLTKEQSEILKEYELNQKQQLTNNFFQDFSLFLESEFNLFKSQWDKSEQLFIKKQFSEGWIISNQNQNISGYVCSGKKLQVNKSYTIRFKFNLPFYKCEQIWIGLLRYELINLKIDEQECLAHCAAGQRQNAKKGDFFINCPNKDEISEIEMRVRQDKGIVQFSDYPNYTNVLQNKKFLDQNANYCLTVWLQGELNKIVQINYYQESIEWQPFI